MWHDIKRTKMKNKNYTTINLPVQVINDIKCLKIAFNYTTSSMASYGEIFAELIRNIEKTNPALYRAYLRIQAKQEEEV